MTLPLDDTIAALASAPGSAARGIVRISGPRVQEVLERVIRLEPNEPQPKGSLPYRSRGTITLCSPEADLPVHVMYWPTRRSYTGQPLVELHTVGSPPLLESVLSEVFRYDVRPARPGEFTLRAFLAGRLDLIEAEAVLGVIDAQDHQELETALKQLGGGLSGEMGTVRSDLLDLLSELEAGLDFVEEDIEFVERSELTARLSHALSEINRLCQQAETRLQTTGRWRVVLTGLPNAGKSCLFNALAGEEAAIVSPIKGTTRDTLIAAIEWENLAMDLVDTAGWEESPSELMLQAEIQRHEQSVEADLLLLCVASDETTEGLAWNLQQLRLLRQQGAQCLVVQTKADLPEFALTNSDEWQPGRRVSAFTGLGLDELRGQIVSQLSQSVGKSRQLIGTTAARCRESLLATESSLQQALNAAEQQAGEELVAMELHQALDHLGRILGTVFTDDILDRIFSKFCIGK